MKRTRKQQPKTRITPKQKKNSEEKSGEKKQKEYSKRCDAMKLIKVLYIWLV